MDEAIVELMWSNMKSCMQSEGLRDDEINSIEEEAKRFFRTVGMRVLRK